MPFFGICLGMQMACIEGRAEHRRDRRRPRSTEFGETSEPVVGIITEWMSAEGLQTSARPAATSAARCGSAPTTRCSSGNSHVATIYGGATRSPSATATATRSTRPIASRSSSGGLVFSGMSPDGLLPEIVERPDHPWFVGVQFHPELKSKPFDPHPLFAGFIAAAVKQARLV